MIRAGAARKEPIDVQAIGPALAAGRAPARHPPRPGVENAARALHDGAMRAIEDSVPVETALGLRVLLPESAPPPRGYPFVTALHGYGEDAVKMAARLEKAGEVPWAWLVLDAPYPFVKETGGRREVGRSWYAYTGDSKALVREMRRSGEIVRRVVERAAERHGLDRGRAALLGYSQGGYLASFLALDRPDDVRGLVAVACRIKVEAFAESDLERARGLAVLAVHGRRDRRTPWPPQDASIERLRRLGLRVESRLHDGGHAFPREEIPAIAAFLADALGRP